MARNKTPKGYPEVNDANGRKRRVHRLRAELALGKPLPPRAVVHHADGSLRPDAPLVICQNQAYHRLLHARMRVVRAGGNPNTEAFCGRCRRILSRNDFYRPSSQCRTCTRIIVRKRMAANREEYNAGRRASYAANRAACAAKVLAWRTANRDRVNARERELCALRKAAALAPQPEAGA